MTPQPESDYTCKYCGAPSNIDPSDQTPPADFCHNEDHEHNPMTIPPFDLITRLQDVLRFHERWRCADDDLTYSTPATPEEVAEAERIAEGSTFNFTCVGCAQSATCLFAFDAYNTDGDCLAAK